MSLRHHIYLFNSLRDVSQLLLQNLGGLHCFRLYSFLGKMGVCSDLPLVSHIKNDLKKCTSGAKYLHISFELVSVRRTPPVFWPLPGTS